VFNITTNHPNSTNGFIAQGVTDAISEEFLTAKAKKANKGKIGKEERVGVCHSL
jgi:hypothetical protein